MTLNEPYPCLGKWNLCRYVSKDGKTVCFHLMFNLQAPRKIDEVVRQVISEYDALDISKNQLEVLRKIFDRITCLPYSPVIKLGELFIDGLHIEEEAK